MIVDVRVGEGIPVGVTVGMPVPDGWMVAGRDGMLVDVGVKKVMVGVIGGVVGVAVPTEAQPADRTRKIIWILCLSLNIGVPFESGYKHFSCPTASASPAAGLARLLPPTSAYVGAEPLINRAVGSRVEAVVGPLP